ncbi:MAG: Flp family type IVb pilin [Thermovenabulum sp.]|uniref:Flp family type IVb pilin n=1 Tax=Thermovenabulum sp. TaxID=3100335 RepID=UPI003C7C7F7F
MLKKVLDGVKRLWTEEEGQGMAEYGLILALVAIVVIGALTVLGRRISNRMNDVANNLGND